jgi:hypothetical protein
MRRVLLGLIVLGAVVGSQWMTSTVFANETIVEKAENKVDDVKRKADHDVRKAKREARKAAGTDNLGKDIKDKAQDFDEDVNTGAKKLKRKVD